MDLGMVGLGRMGANMVERLVRGGHRVVGYDRDAGAVARVTAAGAGGGALPAQPRGQVGGAPFRWQTSPASWGSREPSGSWSPPALQSMRPLPRSFRIFQKMIF